jgi:hypothetical protein
MWPSQDGGGQRSVLPGRGPTMLLAARAGPRNPHAPAHTGRRRQPRRRRRRRGRRIIALPNVTGIMRAHRNIARALGHPVPGLATTHVPLDTLVRPTPIYVQGIPWTPAIWAVAGRVPLTRARRTGRLGGTCAHTGQTQTARHQRRRCQPNDYSLHNPGTNLYSGCTWTVDTSKSPTSVDVGSFVAVGPGGLSAEGCDAKCSWSAATAGRPG